MASSSPPALTAAVCFLNLVSLVRFQPGAPLLSCQSALSGFGHRLDSCRIGRIADKLPMRGVITLGHGAVRNDTDKQRVVRSLQSDHEYLSDVRKRTGTSHQRPAPYPNVKLDELGTLRLFSYWPFVFGELCEGRRPQPIRG